jgi:serine/threonine-protein kinase RsbT
VSEIRRVLIETELDIVTARVEARNLAREMGFGVIDQARIATAISELAKNVILYANSGQIIFRRIELSGRVGLQIICEDQGPGIERMDQILHECQSPARGSGMGLPGTKRLMDEFDIRSHAGEGTTVTVCKWLP